MMEPESARRNPKKIFKRRQAPLSPARNPVRDFEGTVGGYMNIILAPAQARTFVPTRGLLL